MRYLDTTFVDDKLVDRCSSLLEVTFRSSQSQSQSYFATDGQSVSMSWCRAQFGTFDQSFFFFFLKLQGPGPRIYTPQKQGYPDIPPGTGLWSVC
jgi:hypothetical protein